ncbi:MAG TPA: hypothetical protein VJL89_06505, partial [Thermodesulfovibrionia bacterium]|nr:hypothetical protein [Thermodesulfovibrionia bacterium]
YERLYFVPLTELLWEFAVTFGASRLVSQDKESFVEVRAMGNTLSWSPFHAKDDLLWLRWENIDTKRVEQPGVVQDNFHEDFKETCKESQVQTSVKEAAIPLKGSYKFSVSSMLLLIHAFYEKEVLTDDGGIAVVGVKTIGNFRKYRNFLRSGELIRSNESGFSKTDRLTALWNALCQRDYGEIKNSLYYVPSFKGFIDELRDSYPSNAQDISSVISAVFPTYCTLAELSCAGLNIADEGMYKTLNEPPLKEFANIAVNLFNEIAKGEKYILTGQWLEALARQYSIHPVVAKNRLNEARQAGLLERYTEGSTPETQFEKHTMNYLKLVNNMPVVEKINLYYGDFLIPERASVSIRIEGKNK